MEENKNIKQLLQKFVNNDCSQSEVDLVVRYFQAAKQTEDFPTIEEVLEHFQELPKVSEKASDKIIRNILKDSKPKYYIWRYAAAILVVALASTYFLKDTIFNTPIENTVPVIVNNQIQPGSDKATLTLETGETVALVKGASIQTQNASSNGEEIVYDAKNKTAEIAYNTLTIPRGGQFQITLADGTKVWLNSETQLKYPVNFTDGKTRQVELVYGEAYFDVSPSTAHKGSDFKVFNNQQEVQVLGTEFNIKAYKGETNIYTTLVEGKVAVSSANINKVLAPGEQSKMNTASNNITVTSVDIYNEISWKNGVFSFENMELMEVMKVMVRWYDMEISIESKVIEQLRFTGGIQKNQSIVNILTVICSNVNNVSYEIHDKKVILKHVN